MEETVQIYQFSSQINIYLQRIYKIFNAYNQSLLKYDTKQIINGLDNLNRYISSSTFDDLFRFIITEDTKKIHRNKCDNYDKYAFSDPICIMSKLLDYILPVNGYKSYILDNPEFVESFYNVLWNIIRHVAQVTLNFYDFIGPIITKINLATRDNYAKICCYADKSDPEKRNFDPDPSKKPQKNYVCGRAMLPDTEPNRTTRLKIFGTKSVTDDTMETNEYYSCINQNGGTYKLKYIKYKNKYLELKNSDLI